MESKSDGNSALVEIPAGTLSREIFDEAQKLASNYAVIFLIDDAVIGSGTLVRIESIHGILTAHHVAALPSKKPGGMLSICYRDDFAHNLHVSSTQFECVDFGKSSKNRFEHSGPDLSFLIITDDKLLSTLTAKKSFFPLGGSWGDLQNHKADFGRMSWWVSGSPEKSSDPSDTCHDMALIRRTYVHAEATFLCAAFGL